MGKLEDLIDKVHEALTDLDDAAQDAKQRGLEALVSIGAQAQARLDAMAAGTDPDVAEPAEDEAPPVATQLPADTPDE